MRRLIPPCSSSAKLTATWWLGLAAAVLVPLDAFYVQVSHWLVDDGIYTLRRPQVYGLFYGLEIWRLIPPLAFLSILLNRGLIRRHDLGWVAGPPRALARGVVIPGAMAAAAVLAIGFGTLAFARWTGTPLRIEPIDLRSTDLALAVWLHMCVLAPVVEEVIYRSVLVAALDRWRGPAWAMVGSGIAFALLHLHYSRPAWWAPFYFGAGVFFAWTYLRSGSVLVPMALHSLGNFAAWAKDWLILTRREWVEWVLG